MNVRSPLYPLALLASAFLCGCGSITGLDASSTYNCKAPEGVKCDSVSGTYENAVRNNLPSQRRHSAAPASDVGATSTRSRPAMTAAAAPAAGAATVQSSAQELQPLRSPPKQLRLWIKTWQDSDADLNEESKVFVQIDNGRWLVEHAQQEARSAYAPVRAPVRSAAAAKVDLRAPLRPSATASGGGDDSLGIGQALRALQQRGATSPVNDN